MTEKAKELFEKFYKEVYNTAIEDAAKNAETTLRTSGTDRYGKPEYIDCVDTESILKLKK